MELIFLGIVLYIAVFGIGGFAIGNAKGLALIGFIVGAILGPLGVVIMFAVPPAPSHVCPHCGGLISTGFAKCKNCGSELR